MFEYMPYMLLIHFLVPHYNWHSIHSGRKLLPEVFCVAIHTCIEMECRWLLRRVALKAAVGPAG